MNRYKFFSSVGILSIVSLFSLAFMVSVSDLQVLTNKYNEAQITELCSPVKNGLKFCADQQKIIVTSDDPVTLNFSFINMSLLEMEVSKYDSGNFSFKVTDEKGEVILSKMEQKTKSGVMSDDDFKDFIRSQVRNHRSVLLKPNEVFNERIVLSDIYDFKNFGKYYVEVTRKTRTSNQEKLIETSLGKIEIEVKGEND